MQTSCSNGERTPLCSGTVCVYTRRNWEIAPWLDDSARCTRNNRRKRRLLQKEHREGENVGQEHRWPDKESGRIKGSRGNVKAVSYIWCSDCWIVTVSDHCNWVFANRKPVPSAPDTIDSIFFVEAANFWVFVLTTDAAPFNWFDCLSSWMHTMPD